MLGFTKNQYRGGRLSKKGGRESFADLRGGGCAWQGRGGDVSEERVETPMHIMQKPMENIKLDGTATKIKRKIYTLLTLYFKV